MTGVLAVMAIYWLGTNGVTGGGYGTLSLALSGGLAVSSAAGFVRIQVDRHSFFLRQWWRRWNFRAGALHWRNLWEEFLVTLTTRFFITAEMS